VNVYLQGAIVVSDVQFRDPENSNIAVDPTTVTFYYDVGDGQIVSDTLTYTSATVPAVGTIAKMGIGWYRTWIDTSDFAGIAAQEWDGAGTNQAPGEKFFEVTLRGQFPSWERLSLSRCKAPRATERQRAGLSV
jgi:hypothetical protein